MSLLILLLPPRPRSAEAPAPGEWDWAFSGDGLGIQARGRSGPAGWPRATSVLAVLAEGDVAWHRITLPKAPAARLQQALQGLLEEQLLDDEDLHFALPPEAAAGRPAWVAVCHKGWLQSQLALLESGHRVVDRVVAASVPGAAAQGHFMPAPLGADPEALQLAWSGPEGAAVFGLAGTLARARLAAVAAAGDAAPRWTATPAAAAAAEAWLGQPVAVLGEAERALEASRSGWNLRQFDLAARHRGATALRQAWLRFSGPDWRPARIGLAALLAVQLLGLNAWALQERRALDRQREDMVALFKQTFPEVTAVLDAPLQMARQTDALRAAAGQPGADDLEAMLAMAAAAWQDGQGPVASLKYEPGRLELGVPGWIDIEGDILRDKLQPAGWSVSLEAEKLTISRLPGGAP